MAGKKSRLWLKALAILLLLFFASTLFILAKVAQIARELPDPKQFISSRQITQSSKVYDRTGEILLYEIYGEEKRTVIPFEEIPDYVKKATVAIEDKNFYVHPAFDWRAVIRALIVNALKGRIVQGGSTITQQLAKNAFLTPERTLERKVRELILSYWIEKRYSKDEILNLYLNQVSYGANTYGIEAASRLYFNKPTKELSLAEAALLASLPKAPTYYSPWGSHTNELMQRKDYVLEQMKNIDFIDEEERQRAKSTQLEFANKNIGSIKAPHFVMMVYEYLADKYGEEFLRKGGLKITTTLDWEKQQIAEQVIAEGAKRNEELYQGKNAALIAQDPKTGQILALVGSRDYFDVKNEGNFNVAAQGLRQPGSAFKPFAYLTAFKKGFSPENVIFDAPTEFAANRPECPEIVDFKNNLEDCYHPENFDKKFRGPISIRNALAQSVNIPSVKILYLANLYDTIQTAKNLGITTLNDVSRYGLSLVLGGGEVKLIDLVNAYAVFSQDGVKHNQSLILKVESVNGGAVESFSDFAVQVVDSQYVKLLNDVLSDESARQGLYQNSFNLTVFNDRQVAMKTGTSNDYRDAWTIGYTPYLTVGVWAGNNDQKPMQKHGSSILAALPIWNSFVATIIDKYPTETFNKPLSSEGEIIDKPMLNGNYQAIDGQIHSILYYIDKNDPLGPMPLAPDSDPQFKNWEAGVQEWLRQNNLLVFIPIP